jgi:SAM-dependent methyltransferase
MIFRYFWEKSTLADHQWRLDSELAAIRLAVVGCTTLLDLGCGPNSAVAKLPWERSTGVDGFPDVIRQAHENRSHSDLIEGDVLDVLKGMSENAYDAIVALDIIEHLEKAKGVELNAEMSRVARRVVVVGTPNGFLVQGPTLNPLQEHRSGWSSEELEELGYRVIGLFGPKWLRGHGHELRLRPTAFWAIFCRISDFLWTRRHGKSAAGLLGIKHLR